MTRKIFIAMCLCALCGTTVAQTVSNVRAEQKDNDIIVHYDLDKTATISIYYSTDGGETYVAPIKRMKGDVGKDVLPGHKQAVWNVLEDMDKLVCANVVFKVVAGGGNELFTIKDVSFEMVYVEGGTFMMGATDEQGTDAEAIEMPAHRVNLSDFYIGKYEVTQELWDAVMGGNQSYFTGANKPVDDVSWTDCQQFIGKLNRLLGSQLGERRFTLPTEAQWEFAARGGNESKGYKYSGSDVLDAVGWYKENSNRKTHDVGTKQPNELGLYDMSGNVWEWCQDWYGDYSSSSQVNPIGFSSGASRVSRGGGWCYGARRCRVAYRTSDAPSDHSIDLGLRLVLVDKNLK